MLEATLQTNSEIAALTCRWQPQLRQHCWSRPPAASLRPARDHRSQRRLYCQRSHRVELALKGACSDGDSFKRMRNGGCCSRRPRPKRKTSTADARWRITTQQRAAQRQQLHHADEANTPVEAMIPARIRRTTGTDDTHRALAAAAQRLDRERFLGLGNRYAGSAAAQDRRPNQTPTNTMFDGSRPHL